MEHRNVDTRPRHDDPYWRPGDAPPAPQEPRGRGAPIVLLLIGALAVAALVAVLVFSAVRVAGSFGTPEDATTPPPGAAGAPIRVGDAPSDVEAADGAVWTADRDTGTITRVDAATGDTTTVTVGGEPTALVVGRTRIWVWNYASALTPVGLDGTVAPLLYLPRDTDSIALAGDTLLYAQPDTGAVGRLDAGTGAPLPPLVLGGRPSQIAVDGNRLVVLDAAGTVRTVDVATGAAVDTVSVPAGTTTVVAAQGRRYAAGADGVAELRPAGTAPLRYPALTGVDVGPDGVWLLDEGGVLRHLSPDLRELGQITGLGAGGDVDVAPDGRVWILDTLDGTVRAVQPG